MSIQDKKKEQRKKQIAKTAGQLFLQKGFEKVSLLEIAQKLNKGRTTIYEYFNNKEEILAVFLEEEMSIYHQKTLSALSEGVTFKAKLKNFILIQLEYAVQHKGFQQLYKSLSVSSQDRVVETNIKLMKLHQELYNALRLQINNAIENEEIKKLPIELLMELIINATSLPYKNVADRIQTAEGLLDIFWSGISP